MSDQPPLKRQRVSDESKAVSFHSTPASKLIFELKELLGELEGISEFKKNTHTQIHRRVLDFSDGEVTLNCEIKVFKYWACLYEIPTGCQNPLVYKCLPVGTIELPCEKCGDLPSSISIAIEQLEQLDECENYNAYNDVCKFFGEFANVVANSVQLLVDLLTVSTEPVLTDDEQAIVSKAFELRELSNKKGLAMLDLRIGTKKSEESYSRPVSPSYSPL